MWFFFTKQILLLLKPWAESNDGDSDTVTSEHPLFLNPETAAVDESSSEPVANQPSKKRKKAATQVRGPNAPKKAKTAAEYFAFLTKVCVGVCCCAW